MGFISYLNVNRLINEEFISRTEEINRKNSPTMLQKLTADCMTIIAAFTSNYLNFGILLNLK